jgi:hypothetical protein
MNPAQLISFETHCQAVVGLGFGDVFELLIESKQKVLDSQGGRILKRMRPTGLSLHLF